MLVTKVLRTQSGRVWPWRRVPRGGLSRVSYFEGEGRRFRGDVTQYLPVKARHLRLRWSRWAPVTNGPRTLFTATSARQGNSALPGSSVRVYLHLGGGPAGGRD